MKLVGFCLPDVSQGRTLIECRGACTTGAAGAAAPLPLVCGGDTGAEESVKVSFKYYYEVVYLLFKKVKILANFSQLFTIQPNIF